MHGGVLALSCIRGSRGDADDDGVAAGGGGGGGGGSGSCAGAGAGALVRGMIALVLAHGAERRCAHRRRAHRLEARPPPAQG